MSKISSHLSRKLSLGIMLMAVPIFLLALGILFTQSRKLIREEATKYYNSILNTTMLRLSGHLSMVEASVKANAWILEENLNPDSVQVITQRIMRQNPQMISCTFSAKSDTLPQWYMAAVNTGQARWVESFGEHMDDTLAIREAFASYCVPLRSDRADVAGVISADLSFSSLARIVNDTKLPFSNAYFMLLASDGRYLIHPDSIYLFRKTVYTDTDPDKRNDMIALGYEMTAGKKGIMHVNIGSTRCHVCFIPVTGTDWSLALICPDNEVLSSYHRLANVIIVLIVIGLLAIFVLSYCVVKRAIAPINHLLRMSEKIAGGNYNEVIPRSDRGDDIGHLQNGFSAMQQSLRDHMGGIHHEAEALSQRNERRELDIEEVEESQRQKTVFVRNVSHQIRTPLNIILGFANVLRDNIASHQADSDWDTIEQEDLAKISSTMKRYAVQLQHMVLMLFEISEDSYLEDSMFHRGEEVSCNEVARECISHTQTHFPGQKIQLETDLSDAVYILTNHLYLMRSLRELLYNAAKFSDRHHVKLRLTQTETMVRFVVQDVGAGLPEGSLDVIFMPFSKMDDRTEGLGLGLALVKRYAKFLGGELIHDASYHEGCRFILEMPR